MSEFKTIEYHPAFLSDIKALQKRFYTINDDLQIFISSAIKVYHRDGINTAKIMPVSDSRTNIPVFVAKKFRCKIARDSKSFRVVWAYIKKEDRIIFIEIYNKSDKEMEDLERIWTLPKYLPL
jgi:hypothetical protein